MTTVPGRAREAEAAHPRPVPHGAGGVERWTRWTAWTAPSSSSRPTVDAGVQEFLLMPLGREPLGSTSAWRRSAGASRQRRATGGRREGPAVERRQPRLPLRPRRRSGRSSNTASPTWPGVQRNSHRYAHRHALHDPATGRRWTYAELWADAGRLAAGLTAHGVGPGDVVVFDLSTAPSSCSLWLAAQRLARSRRPINFRLSRARWPTSLTTAGPPRSSTTPH